MTASDDKRGVDALIEEIIHNDPYTSYTYVAQNSSVEQERATKHARSWMKQLAGRLSSPSHALPISRAGCSPVPDLEAEEKLLGTPRSTTPQKPEPLAYAVTQPKGEEFDYLVFPDYGEAEAHVADASDEREIIPLFPASALSATACSASSACPICETDTPHAHGDEQIHAWLKAQAGRFNLRVFVCNESDSRAQRQFELSEKEKAEGREAFEAWFKPRYGHLSHCTLSRNDQPGASGQYIAIATQKNWDLWQEAWAACLHRVDSGKATP